MSNIRKWFSSMKTTALDIGQNGMDRMAAIFGIDHNSRLK